MYGYDLSTCHSAKNITLLKKALNEDLRKLERLLKEIPNEAKFRSRLITAKYKKKFLETSDNT